MFHGAPTKPLFSAVRIRCLAASWTFTSYMTVFLPMRYRILDSACSARFSGKKFTFLWHFFKFILNQKSIPLAAFGHVRPVFVLKFECSSGSSSYLSSISEIFLKIFDDLVQLLLVLRHIFYCLYFQKYKFRPKAFTCVPKTLLDISGTCRVFVQQG